jgi:heterodisulfide reductase subunit C
MVAKIVDSVRGGNKITKLIKIIEDLTGQKISKCMYCGMCSSLCPFSHTRAALPFRVNKLVELGLEGSIDPKDLQLCVACGLCRTWCPMNIDMPRVMEALQILIMRSRGDLFDFSKVSAERLSEVPQIATVAGSRRLTRYHDSALDKIKSFLLRKPQERPDEFELNEEYALDLDNKRVKM